MEGNEDMAQQPRRLERQLEGGVGAERGFFASNLILDGSKFGTARDDASRVGGTEADGQHVG